MGFMGIMLILWGLKLNGNCRIFEVHFKLQGKKGDNVQYTRGCAVYWGISFSTPGVFSTLGDIMITLGDTMSTAGGYHDECGDIMSTPGGVQYIGGYYEYTGGYHNECGRYHEYTRGCSVHWGFHTDSIVFPMTFPHIYHDIPQCTHDILQCTEHPQYTHDIPPVYS